MKKPAYYNEFDKQTAAWLRELIREGVIAPGVVDDRSIEDVHPSDLQDFTQCHFFAGIGVWSFALRAAGWPDDRPVWTGSCPCQPFSAAGEGAGFADERHLWPAFHHLIRHGRPAVVLGEQVASKDADPWIDLVQDDLEGLGYRVGAVPFPSAGVGAPHIRDRLYWVADAAQCGRREERPHAGRLLIGDCAKGVSAGPLHGGAPGGLVDANGARSAPGIPAPGYGEEGFAGVVDNGGGELSGLAGAFVTAPAGPTSGFWRDADWLGCRDGKFRPVEPGTFPLADGAPARVLRLRGYGNAINAQAAQAWIEVVREVMECQP